MLYALIAVLVVLLVLLGRIVYVVVRLKRRVAIIVDRLGVLGGLLAPDKTHQRRPEMRLQQGRAYLRFLTDYAAQ